MEIKNIGTTSDNLYNIKHMLKKLGYRVNDSSNTFTSETKTAIESFQNDMGLTVNGVIDTKTYSKISDFFNSRFPDELLPSSNSSKPVEKIIEKVVETKEDIEKPLTAIKETITHIKDNIKDKLEEIHDDFSKNTPILKRGNIGEAVLNLQTKLKKLGFYKDDLDGKFEIKTEEAVKCFQKAEGFKEGGIVGNKTWSLLNKKFEDIKDNIDDIIDNIVEDKKPVLKLGVNSDSVTQVQLVLQELGFFYAKVDGKFGLRTEDAIKYFQASEGLKADGIVGEKTWKKLDKYIKNIDLNKEVVKNRSMLKIGDENEEVSELKSMLKKLSYYDGNIDSIFDEKTDVAVKQFQKSIQLRADGIVGSETWVKLNELSKVNNSSNYIDNNMDMLDVQKKLNKLGFYMGELDGQHSKSLEQAIKNFQTAVTIEPSGSADAITLEKLVEYTTPVTFDEPPEVVYSQERAFEPTYTDNADMLDVQKKLNKLGFYMGELDGQYNSSLEQAIKNFQTAVSIEPSGSTDAITLEKLVEYTTPVTFDEPPEVVYSQERAFEPTYTDNADMLDVQKKLNKLGFYMGVLDGQYNSGLEQAIKNFQTAVSIEPSGSADTITLEKLVEYTSPVTYDEPPEIVYSEERAFEPTYTDNVDMLDVQKKLNQLGFYMGELDGQYNSGLEQAIKNFQTAVSVEPSGSADTITIEKLVEYTSPVTYDEPPEIVYNEERAFEATYTDNLDMLDVQKKLNQLGFYMGELDGQYNSGLEQAIKKFQTAVSVEPSGSADTITIEKLVEYTSPVTYDEPPEIVYSEERAFEPTYTDNVDMLDVQKKLNQLGFYMGELDGQYNSGLEQAIKNFQIAVSIEPSGYADSITLEKLVEYTSPVTYDEPPEIVYSQERTFEPTYTDNVDMLDVQEKLNKLGFYMGELDGQYNSGLEQAIKNFQTAVTIQPSGSVDAITLEKLIEYTTPVTFEEIEQFNFEELKSNTLKLGDVGENVLKLQHKLFQLGFYPYNLDGEFGNMTEEAVKRFQIANDLEPSGIISDNINHYETDLKNYPVLKYGSTGGYVKLLQIRLKQLGFYDGSITGSFDTDTENGVIVFQKINNLSIDGVVGKNTWKQLLKNITKQSDKTINKKTLVIGDSGSDVSELQTALKQQLYFNEDVTGVFDYNTLIAVRAFQFANKLVTDGVVGKNTWAKLL